MTAFGARGKLIGDRKRFKLIHTNKDDNIGIAIEVEYAENGDFAAACRRGMAQIVGISAE